MSKKYYWNELKDLPVFTVSTKELAGLYGGTPGVWVKIKAGQATGGHYGRVIADYLRASSGDSLNLPYAHSGEPKIKSLDYDKEIVFKKTRKGGHVVRVRSKSAALWYKLPKEQRTPERQIDILFSSIFS